MPDSDVLKTGRNPGGGERACNRCGEGGFSRLAAKGRVMRISYRTVAMALAIPVAIASPGAAYSAAPETEKVVNALVAQFQATLIRERRLADDREQALLSQYEKRLAEARRRYDKGLAGARAELLIARGEFEAKARQLAQVDAEAQARIEAYRAEAAQLAAQATPERLAALERFGDGDRVGAWPILDALRQVEDSAAQAASNTRRAVRWREDAELRQVMQEHGEASTEDVLRLWLKAAELDPEHLWTQIYLSRLYRDLGRTAEADKAAARARAIVAVPVEIRDTCTKAPPPPATARDIKIDYYVILGAAVDTALGQEDLPLALCLIEKKLAISRSLVSLLLIRGRAEDESLVKRQVARDLQTRSKIYERLSRLDEALADADESVAIRRHIAAIDPTDARVADLAEGLLWRSMQHAGKKIEQKAFKDAAEGYNILVGLVKKSPHDVVLLNKQFAAALALIGVSVQFGARMDTAAVVMIFSTVESNANFLSSADPTPKNLGLYFDMVPLLLALIVEMNLIKEAQPIAHSLAAFIDGPAGAKAPESARARGRLAVAYARARFGGGTAAWRVVGEEATRLAAFAPLQERELRMKREAEQYVEGQLR